jgi:hypothetical protein
MSSFGPSKQTQQAFTDLGGITDTTRKNSAEETATGKNIFDIGGGNVQAGTNYLNTMLGANRANTTALLQPSIDQIRDSTQGSVQGISTLMPRGGGRSGSLYSTALSVPMQVQNLFNTARNTAATALPGIGVQQQNMGTNLFNIGNQALNTGVSGASNSGQLGIQQQQATNAAWAGLGSGLFGFATAPFGGTVLSRALGGK